MRYIKNWILIGTICAFGGGDIAPYYEPYVELPYAEDCSSGCKKDGVYIDKETGLMWQDAIYDDRSDGAYKRDKSACKAGSLSFAKKYCESLNVGNYYDWRLPTSNEMMALFEKGKIFQDNRDADFWTSTPAEKNKYYVVYTVDGYRYTRDPSQSNYIRCVRCVTKEDDSAKK